MLNRKLQSATVAAPEGPWDLSYAYYDDPNAWNISTAQYSGKSKVVGAEEASPEALFFKPDGTKMYIAGLSGDEINEYNLSTAWDVSTASHVTQFSVVAQDGQPLGLFFRSDGLKMYIVGASNNNVYEYSLSTAWDVSTASYVQLFGVTSQDGTPQGLFFKPDGTKMYMLGSDTDRVYEYDLSTAWDISTASLLQNFSVAPQSTIPTGLFFKPDGTKMYVVGSDTDRVYEYNLSTAWDVSTAAYLQNFSVAAQDLIPNGIYIKPDGTGFYFTGRTNDAVYQYTLGGFSVAAQETSPQGLFFKPDGTKMYVVGTAGDDVNEYNLSTAWNVSTASFVQVFSVATQDTAPEAVFFKSDGTKMYVLGNTGDDVNEYNLSTAWDISTASYLQNFSVAAQDVSPQGLFFKPDGLKMYVTGTTGDTIYEYNLSTAWNISTASFTQSFSVSGQDAAPSGLFFKSDGTKMYFAGNGGDAIYEYNLSTAWDISTASYLQNFNVGAQEPSPNTIFFEPDGTKMFVSGADNNRVYTYTLGPQP